MRRALPTLESCTVNLQFDDPQPCGDVRGGAAGPFEIERVGSAGGRARWGDVILKYPRLDFQRNRVLPTPYSLEQNAHSRKPAHSLQFAHKYGGGGDERESVSVARLSAVKTAPHCRLVCVGLSMAQCLGSTWCRFNAAVDRLASHLECILLLLAALLGSFDEDPERPTTTQTQYRG